MSLLQHIDYVALAPVFCAAGGVIAVLLADIFLPMHRRTAVIWVAFAASAAALVASALLAGTERRGSFCAPAATVPRLPECAYVVDGRTVFLLVLLSAGAAAVLASAVPYLRANPMPAGEFGLLVLASLTGALVLAGARDLITVVVGLETLTVPLYAATALRRRDVAGTESAVTFLLVSVAASAVMLLGVGYLYGLTGTVHLDRLPEVLAARDELRDVPLTSVAVVLLLAGLCFKVAAVPFHGWAPSTYEGAPLPVAAYLSTVSKAGGFAGLLVVLPALAPYDDAWARWVAVLAVLSMTLGNLVAMRQTNLVRLLAWSGVAQTGYLLVGLAVLGHATAEDAVGGAGATLAYLAVYVLMTVGAFSCAIAVSGAGSSGAIEDYRGLVRRNKPLALSLGFFLLGLAGLPPALLGLFGKVVVLRAAFDGDAAWLGLVVALNTVLAFVYYLRVAALLFRDLPDGASPAPVRVGRPLTSVVAGLAALALAAGFVPQLLFGVTPLLSP